MNDLFSVINNKFGTSVVTRYFRLNKGTPTYATIPEVELASHFVIEFDLLLSSATVAESKVMDGGTDGGTDRLDVNWQDANQAIDPRDYFTVFVSGTENGTLSNNGAFNKVRLVRDASHSDQLTKYVDILLARVGNTGSNASGIISNIKIWDDGVLIHGYPINEPSGATIFDTVSNQDGTIINGTDDDRGLFTKQPTLWKGQDLTVPPWDSIDQELLRA